MTGIDTADTTDDGLILGMDTSTRRGVLMLYDPLRDFVRHSPSDPAGNHGRNLIPAIDQLLRLADRPVRSVRRIAVGIGPGSYTGLRVGIAAAKTMAEVLGIPVLPIDSALLPVLESEDVPGSLRLSVVDAQRGEVFVSAFARETPAGRWSHRSGPTVTPWSELHRLCATCEDASFTGPGLDLAARLGPPGIVEVDAARRHASPVALEKWLRNYAGTTTGVSVDSLEPVYVRPSAAEEKRSLNTKSDSGP